MKSVNPHNHPFPHARLVNHKLTPITRLSKGNEKLSAHLISNGDIRNFAISKADEVAKLHGWRMQ